MAAVGESMDTEMFVYNQLESTASKWFVWYPLSSLKQAACLNGLAKASLTSLE